MHRMLSFVDRNFLNLHTDMQFNLHPLMPLIFNPGLNFILNLVLIKSLIDGFVLSSSLFVVVVAAAVVGVVVAFECLTELDHVFPRFPCVTNFG
jgi:hypothetical protein